MKRILFIAESGPLPAIDGKRQRTHAILRALEREYSIDYLIIDNLHDFNLVHGIYPSSGVRFFRVNGDYSTLRARLYKKLGLLFVRNASISRYIQKLISENKYEFLFSRYISPVRHLPASPKIVCDVDDDFEEQYRTRIRSTSGWVKKLRLYQIYLVNRVFYTKLKNRCTRLFFVKEGDQIKDSVVLPNLPFQVLDSMGMEWKPCLEKRILYAGKLSYRPNAEGLKWFLEEVWPLLITAIPTCKLTVVASVDSQDQELERLLLNMEGISYVGRVESVMEAYATHALVIAPVFSGGGSNIKIAEALYMGRPVVTTPFGVRGFEEAQQEGLIWVQDDAYKTMQVVCSLFDNPDNLAKLQNTIFQWARSAYSFSEWEKVLLEGVTN